MKLCLLFILLLSFTQYTFSQQTDFIVLKKRNNRTVKTYYPGAFLSATTWNGFEINGYIKFIRNDSIIFVQEERRLVPVDFGTELDTVYYTLGVDYREIKKWHHSGDYSWGHKRGFIEVAMPKILMIGGTGYVLLELINSAYRKESLNENNKLPSLGIAAAVAIAGYTWSRLSDENKKTTSKKYKVLYMKANEIKLQPR